MGFVVGERGANMIECADTVFPIPLYYYIIPPCLSTFLCNRLLLSTVAFPLPQSQRRQALPSSSSDEAVFLET